MSTNNGDYDERYIKVVSYLDFSYIDIGYFYREHLESKDFWLLVPSLNNSKIIFISY